MTFERKMIKTQWLASGEWSCLLANGTKLAVSQPSSRQGNSYWIAYHVNVILGSELELKKVQTAVSKHLRILQNIRGGSNSSMVWVKTTFKKQQLSSWFIGPVCSVMILWNVCFPSVWSSFWLAIYLWIASSKNIYIRILGFPDFLHVTRNI